MATYLTLITNKELDDMRAELEAVKAEQDALKEQLSEPIDIEHWRGCDLFMSRARHTYSWDIGAELETARRWAAAWKKAAKQHRKDFLAIDKAFNSLAKWNDKDRLEKSLLSLQYETVKAERGDLLDELKDAKEWRDSYHDALTEWQQDYEILQAKMRKWRKRAKKAEKLLLERMVEDE